MTVRLLLAAMCCALCFSPVRAAEDENDGFKSLFDGKTLNGWQIKCYQKDQHWNIWRVDNGTILADSMNARDINYVWLVTKEEYGDFILKLKFQAYHDPGNSGIQIRSRYDDANLWLDGPQIDIHPPQPWRTGMMWDETRGNRRWLFPDLPANKWVDETMAKPRMKFYYIDSNTQWNDMRITAKGTKISAILNGITITDYDGAGVLDDKLHQNLKVGMKGNIALQVHSGDRLRIRFKDLYIKPI